MKTPVEMTMETLGRAALLIGLLLVCSAQSAFPGDQYFPLGPGSRWEYVTEDAMFSGKQEVSVQGRDGNRVQLSLGYTEVVLEDRGDEIDIELEGEGFVPYYRFGEGSWTHRDPFSCDDNRMVQITDREAVVETPAGRFTDCLRIEYSGHTLCSDAGTFVEWWAPGVGRVKWQEDNFAGPVTWVLQDYTVRTAITSTEFVRGDCNDDGNINISDPVCILNWLFLGGPTPGSGCVAVANTNGSESNGKVDLSDGVYLLNHLFLGGPAPTPPFPECGSGTLSSDEGMCETPPQSCP